MSKRTRSEKKTYSESPFQKCNIVCTQTHRTYKTIIHTYNIGYIDHIETEEEKGFHGIS